MAIRSEAIRAIPLGRIVRDIGEFGNELTVYAPTGVELSPEAPVCVVDEEAVGAPEDMEYVLEIAVMKEVIKVWSAWRNGAMPTAPQACEAILRYARFDAYLPAP